jgi:predicted nucleic acid-binding protein
MKKPRIYIDTSVIGGCFDKEFAKWSNGLVKDFKLGNFQPIVSEIVAAEVEGAPRCVNDKYAELIELGAEYLEVDGYAVQLAETYVKHKILTPKYTDDMMHIALAAVAEANILVSWNFKHIVHYDKIRLFNAVNAELGYRELQIYSPREVTNYEEDKRIQY